jgi:hypothetical protein
MSEQIKKVKPIVEEILKENLAARNSHRLLYLEYLNKVYNIENQMSRESFEIFKDIILNKDVPAYSSIARCSRAFQESGQYVGTNRDKRMAEQEPVKEVLQTSFKW